MLSRFQNEACLRYQNTKTMRLQTLLPVCRAARDDAEVCTSGLQVLRNKDEADKLEFWAVHGDPSSKQARLMDQFQRCAHCALCVLASMCLPKPHNAGNISVRRHHLKIAEPQHSLCWIGSLFAPAIKIGQLFALEENRPTSIATLWKIFL